MTEIVAGDFQHIGNASINVTSDLAASRIVIVATDPLEKAATKALAAYRIDGRESFSLPFVDAMDELARVLEEIEEARRLSALEAR